MVTPNGGTIRQIGVVSETPGWSLEVYVTNKAEPQNMGDWTFKTGTNAEKRNRLDVSNAKHYLVLVADTGGKRVRINGIQFFQK
jgi:hypothetical protein